MPLRPSRELRTTDIDPSPKILALLAVATSIAFLEHYYRYSQILLSGDAVAHINIARRVFDSRTPGLSQLGTVWLPLQHLLTIPFIISNAAWSSGIGGAIPSMAGYVFGVLGVYRLLRDALGSRAAAWIGAVIYGANPNLLYVQTTALNEPLSMALFVWAVVWFAAFARNVADPDFRARGALTRCGIALFANILLRYDGWFNGCVFLVAAAAVLLIAQRREPLTRELKKAFAVFVLLVALGPVMWFGWNAKYFGDPLAFARGPYSAKAIEARSRRSGDPHHPGWDAPYVAAQYFVRDTMLNMAAGRLLVGPPQQTAFAPTAHPGRWEWLWLPVAIFGTIAVILLARGARSLLLLWLPLPFYAVSIAWGGVPIFIPVWWPFSYYNTRYALELLPAMAVFFAVAVWLVSRSHEGRYWKCAVSAAALVFVGFSYGSIWRTVPICLREVRANGGARYAMDGQLANILRRIPPESSILMYIGDHGGALQRAAIPLKRTINEGNYELWRQAMEKPSTASDYIIATDGDPVADAVHAHQEGLMIVGVVDSPWQRPIRIYRPIRNP